MKYIFELLMLDVKTYQDFRLNDMISVLDQLEIPFNLNMPIRAVNEYILTNPFLLVDILLNEEAEINFQLKKFLSLCISVKKICRFIAKPTEISDNLSKLISPSEQNFFIKNSKPYCFCVDFKRKKISDYNRVEIIKKSITELKISGPISLSAPEIIFYLLGVFSENGNFFYFGQFIGQYDKQIIRKLNLTNRPYLGPTTTDTKLSLLMVNQAKINSKSVIYDPFCGTGSILIAAASRGAFVLGSDIDINVLKGIGKENDITTNFKKYNLNSPEILRFDNSINHWRSSEIFDAIICDPPYGVRAGAKKGLRDNSVVIPDKINYKHFPKMVKYTLENVGKDMLKIAEKLLKPKGHLVFLWPVEKQPALINFPINEKFEFICSSRQILCGKIDRILVTLKKF